MRVPAEPEAAPVKQKYNKRDGTVALVNYFCSHARMGMRPSSTLDRQILVTTFKRLLTHYTADDIRSVINKFLAQPGIPSAESPARIFASKKTQERMFTMAKKARDDVDRFVANGFVREDDMDIPWPQQHDRLIKQAILRDPSRTQEIIDEYS